MADPQTTLESLKIKRDSMMSQRAEIGKRNPLRDEDLAAIVVLNHRLIELYYQIKHQEKIEASSCL